MGQRKLVRYCGEEAPRRLQVSAAADEEKGRAEVEPPALSNTDTELMGGGYRQELIWHLLDGKSNAMYFRPQ